MATKSTKRTLVELEDGLLVKLSTNADIVKAFPFIAPLGRAPTKTGGCGKCGRAGQDRLALFQQVKMTIAGMGTDQKRKLKDMLNAVSVRVTYRDSKNKTQQLTF